MALAKFPLACTKNTAGNLCVAICEYGNLTSVTVTSGEVSAVTSTAGFKQVGFEIDTLERKETAAVNRNQVSYEKSIEFTVGQPTKTTNTLIDSLVDAIACGVFAIVGDNNGKWWLMGWTSADGKKRPLNMIGVTFESGKEPGEADKNVEKITIQGKSGYKSLPFDASTTALLTAGTATFVDWN